MEVIMLERLKIIGNDIRNGENIDLYLLILLSIFLGISGIIGVLSFEILSAAILATLGLLANALLENRRSLEKISSFFSQLEALPLKIESLVDHQTTLDEVFRTRSQLPQFEAQLHGAQSIDMCGMSMLALTTLYRDLFVDKLRNGCRIRLILLNPDNLSLMEMVSAFVTSINKETHTNAIKTSIQSLTTDNVFNTDLLEVRIYDYPLSHGMLIVNGDSPHGKLRVELYMSKGMPANAPGFYIQKHDDSFWFEVFKEEFDSIWEKAIPCQHTQG